MDRFLLVRPTVDGKPLFLNKASIEAIVEEKNNECSICLKNTKATLSVLDCFEELQKDLPNFLFARLEKKDNKILINLDNVIAFYEGDNGTFVSTNVTTRKFLKGYLVDQSIGRIQFNIKWLDGIKSGGEL